MTTRPAVAGPRTTPSTSVVGNEYTSIVGLIEDPGVDAAKLALEIEKGIRRFADDAVAAAVAVTKTEHQTPSYGVAIAIALLARASWAGDEGDSDTMLWKYSSLTRVLEGENVRLDDHVPPELMEAMKKDTVEIFEIDESEGKTFKQIAKTLGDIGEAVHHLFKNLDVN